MPAEHDLYIICDEIYDKIVFDDQFTGIGKVAKDAPLILLNGFSKAIFDDGLAVRIICTNSDSRKLDDLTKQCSQTG